jgi:hypothetical protein
MKELTKARIVVAVDLASKEHLNADQLEVLEGLCQKDRVVKNLLTFYGALEVTGVKA